MKAAQIQKYSKDINVQVVDIPVPKIGETEVLIKVKTAAVNPLELLNITGSVKLIQDYEKPFTLGNELTGVIEEVGSRVVNFKKGDKVYSRLPIAKIGAFAEYAAVDQSAIWFLPQNLDYVTGAGVPLTGLTAYQGLTEVLQAKPGQSVFIPGGSGSFGQMAVPIAKALGLQVIVSGNAAAKDRILQAGADQYLDYKKENYWEVLDNVDFVIDTLGVNEIDHELSILKPNGKLLSLIAGPNKQFAIEQKLPKWKQWLFGAAGSKLDKKAEKQQAEYRFIFVRSDGEQLRKVTEIVEKNNIVPAIDSHDFTIEQINEAILYVKNGHPNGKVVIKFT
ncbi:NADP-dependent oxidoreductase [Candidatus Enterococcus murrayae]|uniref:NADP-dependent oxidoreductase n=1 Tax=Candidatus Enterococcus murrayae TaxID=2815321 RepID=A0ABS3HEC8_9ENTE|nr:NADP-dependent oxidoreductase [Enterococcus sp. MJM16]MBO0451816.1 NADP-dependent oxidoreductase [Enterococcus sp. MJM16]